MSKHTPEHESAKDKETGKSAENMEERAGEKAAPESGAENQTAGDEAGSPGENPAGEAKELSPEEKIARLEAQLAGANDQYLRKAADFENYRKRMSREKQDAIDYANQSLLLDLIQTMDDFDRALKSAESYLSGGEEAGGKEAAPAVFKTFYEGVSMIEKRLSSQLENKWGLKRFDSLGLPFDPNMHEALMMDKSPDVSEPTVLEEFYKGYSLKDRVVRSAKVKVIMPADGEARKADAQTENGENAENSPAK